MYIILLLLCFFNVYSIRIFKHNYLNKNQFDILKKYIVSPDTNLNIKNQIKNILYKNYDDWSYYKAFKFKKFHYNKCKHISVSELYLYSNKGLINAIQNYNGKSNFSKYANIYVNGELYKGLTELYPISNIHKKERIKSKNKNNLNNLDNYIKKRNTIFVGNDDWLYNKLNIKNNDSYLYKNYWEYNYDNYYGFWEKVKKLNSFEIYLINSKFNFYLEKKSTNLEISNKLGYSEEYIRITIVNALKKILINNDIKY